MKNQVIESLNGLLESGEFYLKYRGAKFSQDAVTIAETVSQDAEYLAELNLLAGLIVGATVGCFVPAAYALYPLVPLGFFLGLVVGAILSGRANERWVAPILSRARTLRHRAISLWESSP